MQESSEPTTDERLTREIEKFANDVARRASEGVERQPTGAAVARLMKSVAAELDQKISAYQAIHEGEPLACRKGCSWCCHELVVTTPIEILSIHHIVMTTFDESQKQALLERLSDYDEKMRNKYDQPPTFVRAACSFLVDSECTIYENRPFGCRGANSTDADLCRMWAESPGDGQSISFLGSQKVVAKAAEKGLSVGASGRLGGKMHDLNRCLKMLFDEPGLSEKILAGKATFPVVPSISKPRLFPPDQASVMPLGIGLPAYQEALNQAWLGNWKATDAAFPENSLAHLMIKLRTPGISKSSEQIEEYRIRLDEALTELENREIDPLQLLPGLVEHMMDVLPYQGLSVRTPLERQGKVFLNKAISRIYPHLCAPIEGQRKPGRFRLGYISSVLNHNNANRWALGWVRNHGPEFETFAFNLGAQDIGSRLWERDVEHYYALQGNGQRIAEFIRSLDLDALIVTDIGCRNYDYVYFSMRLARVQCTAWGQPVTSGLPNIDYYISSEMMEPEGAQEEYSEKLVLLPRSGLCYPRPKSSLWEHGYTRPHNEFLPLMAQNIRKWTPRCDPLLKRISDRFGKPLRFIGARDVESSNVFSERLMRAGIPHVIEPPASQRVFANYLREATVSFDPPDWSGGNTTIEALSYGIPVVTFPGSFMRGRHSLAFLQIANAPGLIARDEDDYVGLIFDVDRQREAMRDLDADALYEDKGVVEALDRFLLSLMPPR